MTRIVADFCSNHLGDRRLMEEGIKRLAEIGVDYVKFQTFGADRLNPNYPDYNKMYDYYKKVELSETDHLFILEKCELYGINPLFTAFDLKAVDLLDCVGVREVKIASPDADNWDLIIECSNTFNNVFISCGMIHYSDLNRLRKLYPQHTYFYCISKYPTAYEDIDWGKVVLFDGFSDHTADIKASLKAIDLGVEYIERHFTLGKDLPGKDHKISSTVEEFKALVEEKTYLESIKKYKSRWTSNP